MAQCPASVPRSGRSGCSIPPSRISTTALSGLRRDGFSPRSRPSVTRSRANRRGFSSVSSPTPTGWVCPHTRACVALVNHISNESALVLPVADIAQRCHGKGVLVLVDGAHGPGSVALDIPALGVDWYIGNLHKWAWAPRSSGLLWTAKERQGSPCCAPRHRPLRGPDLSGSARIVSPRVGSDLRRPRRHRASRHSRRGPPVVRRKPARETRAAR